MINTNNPLTSLSYTNKDFESIYPELLETVKKLSYKWDPTISNESDPGVVLLKLNALIADKVNYNSDVNVLECFPISVTQERNARNLYRQLGYYMHWYNSATTTVSIAWSAEASANRFTIPAFTMVSDDENSIVYTLLGASDINSISDTSVSCDGTIYNFRAMQGVAVNYDINGQQLIKTSDLDENHRLYFTTNSIAENGIFIKNSDSSDWNSWTRVDNLLVENSGQPLFQFGITQDDEIAYLEFPEDCDKLFGNGINIVYLMTEGYDGNVGVGVLNKLYNDITVLNSAGAYITLNSSNIALVNTTTGTGGLNTETIEDAYIGYQRTIGTFDTLVTLRDYYNAIVSLQVGDSGVSNGFVCDRTNDIQNTFKVLTLDSGVDTIEVAIEQKDVEMHQYKDGEAGAYFTIDGEVLRSKVGDMQYVIISKSGNNYYLNNNTSSPIDLSEYGLEPIAPISGSPIFLIVTNYDSEPVLDSYSLKLYFTQYVDSFSTASDYNTSFSLKTNLDAVKSYIDDEKCINHDYKDLDSLIADKDCHICMIKNKYPVEVSIVPSYKLTEPQKNEVKNTVVLALYNNLNARKINFGQKITSEDIKDIIENSDGRIKSVNIRELDFKTYAVFIKNDKIYEALISEQPPEVAIDTSQVKTTGTGYYTIVVTSPSTYKSMIESLGDDFDIYAEYKLQRDNVNNVSGWYLYYKDNSGDYDYGWSKATESAITLSDMGLTEINPNSKSIQDGSLIYLLAIETFAESKQIREEIYAKSILAGKTPYLVDYDVFDVRADQAIFADGAVMYNADGLEAIDRFTYNTANSAKDIKDNEVIQLFGPSLSDIDSYSNYVKYQIKVGGDVSANSDYMLLSNEYIVFYWKNDSSDEFYQYKTYGSGNIIHPSFGILERNDGAPASVMNNLDSENTQSGVLNEADNAIIANIHDNTYILSGNKEIKTRAINQITIGLGVYCGWVTNTEVNDKYLLFSNGDTKYTLEAEEYFIYADSKLSNYSVVGPGTTLQLESPATYDWYCDKINLSIFVNDPGSINNTYWTPLNGNLIITENQILTLTSKNKIKFSSVLNNGNEITSLQDYDIDPSVEISYSSDGSSWTGVQNLYLGEYGWTLRVRLNVDIGPNKEQIFFKGQLLCLLTGDYTTSDCSSLVEVNQDSGKVAPDNMLDNTLYVVNINRALEGGGSVANPNGRTMRYLWKNVSGVPTLIGRAIKGIGWVDTTDSCVTGYTTTAELSESILSLSKFRVYSDEVRLYYYFKLTTDEPVWGNLEPPKIGVNEGYSYSADGKVKIDFDTEHDTRRVTIRLPKGDYILSLNNTLSDINSLTLTYNGNLLSEYGNPNVTDFHIDGKYNIAFTSENGGGVDLDGDTTAIFIEVTGLTSPGSLFIENVFRYKLDDTNADIIDMDAVSDKLEHLLTYSDYLFDYTYQVPENDMIANPLQAESFFNIGHVLHQYMICQLDTSNSTVAITGDN